MNLDQLFGHWDQIRTDLLTTIDKFDPDELAFIPFDGSWPVGQIMLHIADAEEGWFRYVIARERQDWPTYSLGDNPTPASIKSLLGEVHDRTKIQLASLDLIDLDRDIELPNHPGQSLKLGWIIWHVLEHEIHHRGELSFALGLLGRDGLDV